MTANNSYPIELMHPEASRIFGPCLIMSHLMDTLYKCYNCFPIMLNGAVTFQRIKVTDAERTEENAKNVYPVMEVVAEVVRSTYVPNK